MKQTKDKNKIGLATERLKLWGDTLNMLAQGDTPAKLVSAMETSDRKGLESLLESTKLFQLGGCIDIVDTITKVINFSPGHFEERCDVISRPFIGPPSEADGMIYRLPDGSFVFISERLWVDYSTRAQQDAAWREQNKGFLKSIGVLRCSYVWVQNFEIVSVSTTRPLCFLPPVITP